jgi:class 3 adenylate cyclase
VEESDGDLMGDGVNTAARLEGLCEPGGVCLSEQAYWLAADTDRAQAAGPPRTRPPARRLASSSHRLTTR